MNFWQAGTLPAQSSPPDHYRMPIVACGWLTANQRGHWAVRCGLIKQWRQAADYTARYHRVPPMAAANIVIELCFRAYRRRDPANWAPTGKAIVDGLVDAGVLPDDRAELVTGPDMRLGPLAPLPAYGTAIVHIFPRQPLAPPQPYVRGGP